jgi:hypothetical protein
MVCRRFAPPRPPCSSRGASSRCGLLGFAEAAPAYAPLLRAGRELLTTPHQLHRTAVATKRWRLLVLFFFRERVVLHRRGDCTTILCTIVWGWERCILLRIISQSWATINATREQQRTRTYSVAVQETTHPCSSSREVHQVTTRKCNKLILIRTDHATTICSCQTLPLVSKEICRMFNWKIWEVHANNYWK